MMKYADDNVINWNEEFFSFFVKVKIVNSD